MQIDVQARFFESSDDISSSFFCALFVAAAFIALYLAWDDYRHLIVKNKVIYPTVFTVFLCAIIWDLKMTVGFLESDSEVSSRSLAFMNSSISMVILVVLNAIFFGLIFGTLYFFAYILNYIRTNTRLTKPIKQQFFLGLGDVKYAIFLGQIYGVFMYLHSYEDGLRSVFVSSSIFVYLMITLTCAAAILNIFITLLIRGCILYFLGRKSHIKLIDSANLMCL